MAATLQSIKEQIAARPPKEQFMIVVGGAMLVAFVLVQAANAPLGQYVKKTTEAMTKLSTTLATTQGKLATLRPEDVEHARREREDKIAALRAQQADHEALTEALRTGVVKRGEMGQVLAAMMRGHSGVKVTELKSLPSVALSVADGAKESSVVSHYKHPLRISVSGRYVALARYADALEKLPWKIFWVGMTLDAREGAEAHATLELFTIGQEASWFGAS